jgi:D-tyrosyl-tRNA(Tyr) deacylase
LRAVIQRVTTPASVEVDQEIVGSIDKGLVVLLGIQSGDTQEDIDWLSKKIIGLRIFNDDKDVMNLSLNDIGGNLLVISQFTLHASTKKGNRPSYIKAEKPDKANIIYRQFIDHIKSVYKLKVEEGRFGADMKLNLINDGPVTILIDTKIKE